MMEAGVDWIVRHPKERRSKCSLEPLRGREDLVFSNWRADSRYDASGYVVLEMGAPEIGPEDGDWPLLLLDSTWRLLPAMRATVWRPGRRRSLPGWLRTAYPRSSKLSADPQGGLASVEALYAARWFQGRSTDGLLDLYYWREAFLRGLRERF